MTDLNVYPSKISGEVEIPSSKSHSIRAIVLASLANGTSHIKKTLNSPDVHHAIKACKQMGAKITQEGETLSIVGTAGKFFSQPFEIESGNSGQVLRFIGALAVLSAHSTIITGDHSIQTNRPIKPLINALKQLGAHARSIKGNDLAPIEVKGPVSPGFVQMEGRDSQPVSALLMLAAFLNGVTEIQVSNPGETPWIDLTLYWLKKLGIPFENESYKKYKIFGKNKIDAFNYTVPGDFSSAAFPAICALISDSSITLKNMDLDDPQGDKKLFDVLKSMGAQIVYQKEQRELLVQRKNKIIKGKHLDINDYIDSIAILSVLGCFSDGKTIIDNAAIAREKESDRIACMTKELKKMGASITEKKEGLIVKPSVLTGAVLSSHHDHRVAMALTIAALNAKGKSTLCGIDCISKSYPTFIEDMKKLGAKLEVL